MRLRVVLYFHTRHPARGTERLLPRQKNARRNGRIADGRGKARRLESAFSRGDDLRCVVFGISFVLYKIPRLRDHAHGAQPQIISKNKTPDRSRVFFYILFNI